MKTAALRYDKCIPSKDGKYSVCAFTARKYAEVVIQFGDHPLSVARKIELDRLDEVMQKLAKSLASIGGTEKLILKSWGMRVAKNAERVAARYIRRIR